MVGYYSTIINFFTITIWDARFLWFWNFTRGFWHFTLNFFIKNWQYAPICKLYRGVPLFRYLITLKSSSIKYSIRIKSSYTRSNFKKKKFAWNSTFRKSSSMQKKIYKCDRPIFREFYSGVFKPYSDVLKPYSGVFLQNFL